MLLQLDAIALIFMGIRIENGHWAYHFSLRTHAQIILALISLTKYTGCIEGFLKYTRTMTGLLEGISLLESERSINLSRALFNAPIVCCLSKYFSVFGQ